MSISPRLLSLRCWFIQEESRSLPVFVHVILTCFFFGHACYYLFSSSAHSSSSFFLEFHTVYLVTIVYDHLQRPVSLQTNRYIGWRDEVFINPSNIATFPTNPLLSCGASLHSHSIPIQFPLGSRSIVIPLLRQFPFFIQMPTFHHFPQFNPHLTS